MLSTERADFETHLSILFGGYPTFLTPPRIEAYWRGLSKMPLSLFVRCVDFALGESGTDKLPTVNALWQISRRLRAPAPIAQPAPQVRVGDDFLLTGNRWLFAFLLKTGGVPADAVPWLVELKNRIVEDFRHSGDECGGPTTTEWLEMAVDAFAKRAKEAA